MAERQSSKLVTRCPLWGFKLSDPSEGRVRMARSAGGGSPVMAKTVNRVRSYAALTPARGGACAAAGRTP